MNRLRAFLSMLAFASMVFVLSACDEDDDLPPTETGIEGRVFVQNEFGEPLYNQRGGTSIFLEVGFRSFNIQGDQVGRYRLSGAPVGTYTATYSKDGCGTIVIRGIRVNVVTPSFPVLNGFQQWPSVTLTKLPTTAFTGLSATLNGQEPPLSLLINATMVPAPPPTGQPKGFRVFVASGDDVSSTNYNFQKHFTSTTAEIDLLLEDELFDNIPNVSGGMLSIVIYGDANFDESFELQNEEVVFPNLTLEPSDRVTVVLP